MIYADRTEAGRMLARELAPRVLEREQGFERLLELGAELRVARDELRGCGRFATATAFEEEFERLLRGSGLPVHRSPGDRSSG